MRQVFKENVLRFVIFMEDFTFWKRYVKTHTLLFSSYKKWFRNLKNISNFSSIDFSQKLKCKKSVLLEKFVKNKCYDITKIKTDRFQKF